VVLKAYQTLCSRAIGHCANGRSAGKYTKNGRLEIQERVSRECKKKKKDLVLQRGRCRGRGRICIAGSRLTREHEQANGPRHR
jgi:hypothetical protein